ncbi:MAG: response regulator [Desulfobulbaceae bacterium]|nr:response regulator [Desulfobulbaceae bacterium]
MFKAQLLVVDDDPHLLTLLARKLRSCSYKTFCAASGQEALKILRQEHVDVLITDYRLPVMDGCQLIAEAIQIDPLLQSIVITGYINIESAISAMGAGAFNYLQKPINFDELNITIEKSLEKQKLLQDVQKKQRSLEKYRDQLEDLVEQRTLDLTAANRILKKEIEERKNLEISLRDAKSQAENANRAKSEFLANMSHEIRTPITSAIGLLNLVLDTKLEPKQKAYLEMARVSTTVMHNLLNDILDFSKIESGKLNLESISFNPKKIISSVIDLQSLYGAEKSIELVCSVAANVPSRVTGDPTRLRQILLNLVSNAIKFTQFGKVEILCKLTNKDKLKGTAAPKDTVNLHFSVRDSGIGIEKDKMDIIFMAFTQADSSTTRKFGGVGLGLNISSKLVALLGGRIWLDSEPGKGSTFHFTCQFCTQSKKIITPDDRTMIASSHASGDQKPPMATVLVAEDDMTNQLVIREILESRRYTVIIASDGVTALQEIKSRSIDLLLLDLKMPEMDGYEVVRQIRLNESLSGTTQERRLPIIALTGFASEDEKQKCLDAGMDDFSAKPFGVDRLLALAGKYIPKTPRQGREEVRQPPAPDISLLQDVLFNEKVALKKALGNRSTMLTNIVNFKLLHSPLLEKLTKIIPANTNVHHLVPNIQKLKEMAMASGATKLADEYFSLLMQMRNNQEMKLSYEQLETLRTEFENFINSPEIRRILNS